MFDILNNFQEGHEEKIEENLKNRTDRKILDFKAVKRSKKEKLLEKSIDLGMGDDEHGQPFHVM